MILSALYEHYGILQKQQLVPLNGYSNKEVSFALVIDETGQLISLYDLRKETAAEKTARLRGSPLIIPEHPGRSRGVKPYFICDKSDYLLGLKYDKGKWKTMPEHFEAEADLVQKVAGGTDEFFNPVLKFFSNYTPEELIVNPMVADKLADLAKGELITFKFADDVKLLPEYDELKQAWERYLEGKQGGEMGQCLITGEYGKIARLHPQLNGFGQDKPSLVSFNDKAFESHGKEQGANAPVGENAAFKYGQTLNYLLAHDCVRLGETRVVFWAESEARVYSDIFSLMLEGSGVDIDQNPAAGQVMEELKALYKAISQGRRIEDITEKIDPQVKFYVLGLEGNKARAVVKFFHRGEFGEMVARFFQHQQDIALANDEDDLPGVHRLLYELIPKKSNERSFPTILAGQLMRSILTGTGYPSNLYSGVLNRIRSEVAQEVPDNASTFALNKGRVRIIKGFLCREGRIKDKKYLEEVTRMALNEDCKQPAYIYGRLFAEFERLQKNASDSNLNTTIKNRYFTAASTSPGAVFPILFKLSQHHLNKPVNQYADKSERSIQKLIDMLEDTVVPKTFNLEEQGTFMLGYYHQRQAFFVKKPNGLETKGE